MVNLISGAMINDCVLTMGPWRELQSDRCKTETAWKLRECTFYIRSYTLHTGAEIKKTLIQMKLASHTYIHNCHHVYHKSLKRSLTEFLCRIYFKNKPLKPVCLRDVHAICQSQSIQYLNHRTSFCQWNCYWVTTRRLPSFIAIS